MVEEYDYGGRGQHSILAIKLVISSYHKRTNHLVYKESYKVEH